MKNADNHPDLLMNNTLQSLKRILKCGRPVIPSFIILGFIEILLVPIQFYGLILSKKLIDKGFLLQNWDIIKGIIFTLIIIFMFKNLISYTAAVYSTRLQLRINKNFQEKLLSHILRLPVKFFTKEPTGKLMSRVLIDAERFSSILGILLGPLLISPLKITVLTGFLLYININLCLIMLAASFISFIVIRQVGNSLRIISKLKQEKKDAIYSHTEQIFANIELTKSKIAEPIAEKIFKGLINDMINLSLKELNISLVAQPVLQILKYLSLGSVVFYGSWLISNNLITIGNLTIFLGATYLLFNEINSMGSLYGILKEGLAKMESIYGILDTHPEKSNKKSSFRIKSIPYINSIKFKNVSFRYENASKNVLQNISFSVSSGEMVGIAGQSGSGKTTIMRLLVRFHDPCGGSIILNERLLREFDLDMLRRSIGLAFQENLILNNTISENIAYGNTDISINLVEKASKISLSHDFITSLPGGYNTKIGEWGKSLSGGERQRLAIARAIITDPEILILDESTSFLDIENEEKILSNIKEARKKKITLIISHRPSTIKMADRVITLDNGMILD